MSPRIRASSRTLCSAPRYRLTDLPLAGFPLSFREYLRHDAVDCLWLLPDRHRQRVFGEPGECGRNVRWGLGAQGLHRRPLSKCLADSNIVKRFGVALSMAAVMTTSAFAVFLRPLPFGLVHFESTYSATKGYEPVAVPCCFAHDAGRPVSVSSASPTRCAAMSLERSASARGNVAVSSLPATIQRTVLIDERVSR